MQEDVHTFRISKTLQQSMDFLTQSETKGTCLLLAYHLTHTTVQAHLADCNTSEMLM